MRFVSPQHYGPFSVSKNVYSEALVALELYFSSFVLLRLF